MKKVFMWFNFEKMRVKIVFLIRDFLSKISKNIFTLKTLSEAIHDYSKNVILLFYIRFKTSKQRLLSGGTNHAIQHSTIHCAKVSVDLIVLD